jgi:hypothetical protein
MTELHSPDVRLALLEQSVEKILDIVEGLALDAKRSAEAAAEVAILRNEQTRLLNDIADANRRIDRVRSDCSEDRKANETTVRKLWYCYGIATGLGFCLAIVVGVVSFVGSDALSDITKLQGDIQRIEIDIAKGAFR